MKFSDLYFLLVSFGTGLLASLTPCIYPMVPIILGVLQTQQYKSFIKNFLLSCSYVLGMSLVYATLGYIAAKSAILFGQWLNNLWIILIVILFLLYLAFSMFGFYEIKIPKIFIKRLDLKVGGSIFYSFIFGMISGTVVSPCLTPALVFVLGLVTKTANPILGFLSLWFFALGMGVLLILIGTFSTVINFLPRAGFWMIEIKKIFGFIMLAMCIYFLQPFFSFCFILKLYSILVFITSVYYFSTSNKNKLKIIFAILLVFLSLFLLSWSMIEKCKIIL
ncbi:hypothetical protein GF322_03785 [Candidatus Dependentiae bacterium]|nr:hypothetical protein [Candidatus Dependentiae bacterium]